MTKKPKDITTRLLAAAYCEQGCEGRCQDCPIDVANDAANEIIRLRAALAKAEDEKFEYGQERYSDGFGDGSADARENL